MNPVADKELLIIKKNMEQKIIISFVRKTMLLKQLIPYKIQKNNDMNNHIRNFSDIIDKLKEMEIKLVKKFINNISMILLYNISYENFRIIIEVQEELPTLKILKVRLLKEVKVRKRYKI